MDVPLYWWIGLIGVVVVMLAIDLLMHRDHHVITMREAAAWSGVWVAIGLGFGGLLWWQYGADIGLQYVTGYVIEKSLAVDNVVVWALILAAFAVPRHLQHRVLAYGVIGALIFRAILIAGGAAVLEHAAWVLYVFGAFLVITGVRMLRDWRGHPDISSSRMVAWVRRVVPVSDGPDGARFVTRVNGRRVATPLLLALVVVEISDLIFAVDSIPAIFAVTQEPFLVLASNALAILGLRSMYFLVEGLLHRFVYLKAALALVLVWVGVKIVVAHAWFPIPTVVGLAVVVAILAVGIIASLIRTRHAPVVTTPITTPTTTEGARP